MSTRFPHLTKANQWPGLDTVDPYDLQVTFDPYLWTANVTLHLCNTKLDPLYENIGGWPTAASRDQWFDSISDRELTLDTELHILPGQTIKLPFAFEVLNQYNHIYIDFPPTPVEHGNPETHRYYYFISDVEYRSPSSTACVIQVDEWTTHMFDIDIRYIELERGHAPLAAITADQYLANPRDNCEFLTVPDESYGHGTRIPYTAQQVINAGPHWLVFTMTSDAEQDPGTCGHRENWRVPTTSANHLQGALSTPSVFAIDPDDANLLINRINERAPQLMPTVQAVFLIPKRLVTTGTTFQFLGVSCREITPTQTVTNLLTLNKSMFAYPDHYKNLAKLYTSPYAWLESVDETGSVRRIQIEDTTGQLKLSLLASILMPFLGIDAYITGIGNGSEQTITWDNLESHSFQAYGDWTSELRHWNIPTYAIMQNSERTFEWSNHWQREQARETNSRSYNLAIDNNNLNYGLRQAALDRQTARIGQQQAHDVAQRDIAINYATLINAANIAKSWDDETADEEFMQLSNSLSQSEVGMSWSNADAVAANQVQQAQISVGQAHQYADYVEGMGNVAMAQSIVSAAQNTIGSVTSLGNGLGQKGPSSLAQGFTADTAGAGVAMNAANVLLSGFNAGLDIGATYHTNQWNSMAAAAAAGQAQLSLTGAAIQQQNINASYAMMMANNSILINETAKYMVAKVNNGVRQANDILNLQNAARRQTLSTQHSYQSAINAGDVALTRAQIGSTKGMSDRSALNTKELQDEALANAQRAARLGSPSIFAQPTGNTANYTRPQAIMVNIRTQDRGAIAAAGDQFLRYGYRLAGRQWTIQTLTPMRSFTYWQGRVHIGTAHTNAVTREVIQRIFENGTTVWTSPTGIGVTSIYDNGA